MIHIEYHRAYYNLVTIIVKQPEVKMAISIDLMIFLAILLCYVYVILSAFFTHRKCNFIHETTISILLGLLLGALILAFTDIFASKSYENQFREVVILILLPPMLFEDGYNIRKRKFFQNILYINLYGILGTLFNFLVLFGLFYGFNYFQLIRSINNEVITLQTWQMLAMASCLLSIDTVVPEKIVNPERYPKLFSIIFGESILKDTITVTLFDSIINIYKRLYANGNTEFDASSIGFLVLRFFEVVGGSILIGTCCGIVTTFLFKNLRFLLDEKGVSEVALVILTGYSSYIMSEWATFSGVIAMLFCGITLSHFNIYNLTDEGRASAKISISALAKVAEGLLFFLLGAFIFGIQVSQQSDKTVEYTFSWTLLLICIMSLLLGRLINIYLMSLVGYLIVGKDKWRLNFYEYEILTMSGLVKGAIPFALVLAMPTTEHKFTTACVQNTVITMVFLTSLLLNSFLPKILRNRLGRIDEMIKSNQNHPSLYDSLLIEYQQKEVEYMKQHDRSHLNSNRTASNNDSQIGDRFQSKKQLQKIALLSKLKSTTQKYWRRCQQGFLKPFLIYDYHNRKQQIKMEKIKQRKQQVQIFWRKFTGQNILDPENQQDNKFIDVKIIESDDFSEDGRQFEEQNGEIICYVKKQRSNTKMQQQIVQIKDKKSKTQLPENLKTQMKKIENYQIQSNNSPPKSKQSAQKQITQPLI